MTIYIGVTQRSAPITLLIGWGWESVQQKSTHVMSLGINTFAKVTTFDGLFDLFVFVLHWVARMHQEVSDKLKFVY